MIKLLKRHCKPCEEGGKPLTPAQIKPYLPQISRAWQIKGGKKIERTFRFKDFKATMAFINRVAALAEKEGHHPDLAVFYSRVVVRLWTHKIGGLSENDFILAAKIDRL